MSLSRKHRNRLSLFFGIEQRFFESNKSFEKRLVNIAYKPSIILCLTDLFNLLKFYDNHKKINKIRIIKNRKKFKKSNLIFSDFNWRICEPQRFRRFHLCYGSFQFQHH